MSAVAIIPARGGSRRIPHKNRKLFHGKPIIAYSIETAKQSGLFDMVVVSTDDLEIVDIAIAHGVGVVPRDAEMSKDEIGTQEVTRHALQWSHWDGENERPDYACCIYPCAPMMTAEDLRVSFAQLKEQLAVAIVEFVYVEGWYYWGTTAMFLHGYPVGQALTRNNWIDINTPEDWSRAEAMYAALHPEVA